ncbi:MAG: VOC family protein [Alteromonadaceae bacterium]|nr:VOC family protein [Alteromonadaceae bacterium]
MTDSTLINYVELPCCDIPRSKAFFADVFGWSFTDYGPDYCEFKDQGITGGFYRSDKASLTENGAVLLVFYTPSLEAMVANVERHGGRVIKPIFDFPGGRRFHFCEPSGNEFAIWSDR